MKILHVGKYYPPVFGGIESHVHDLCAGLAGQGHDVTALVFNKEARTTDEVIDGVRVIRVASRGRMFSTEVAPSFLPWFRRLCDADLIHLHTPNPIGELACMAAPRRAGFVLSYHSDVVKQKLLGRIDRMLLRRLMTRADRVVASTQRYMETSPVLSRFADKTAIIPYGIDLAAFHKNADVAARAERIRQKYGPKIAAFVGRLVYYKGVEVLLRALASVPDANLLIVGNGPLEGDLKRLADELGIAARVHFLGSVKQEEKIACYHASDVFVLPSTHRSEAFGIVQIEAQACARPILCANIDSGVPFVTVDGETGLVVTPGDHAEMAGALNRLFDDPDLARRMGRAGRERAERVFSREVMLRNFTALYEDILDARGRAAVRPGSPLPVPAAENAG